MTWRTREERLTFLDCLLLASFRQWSSYISRCCFAAAPTTTSQTTAREISFTDCSILGHGQGKRKATTESLTRPTTAHSLIDTHTGQQRERYRDTDIRSATLQSDVETKYITCPSNGQCVLNYGTGRWCSGQSAKHPSLCQFEFCVTTSSSSSVAAARVLSPVDRDPDIGIYNKSPRNTQLPGPTTIALKIPKTPPHQKVSRGISSVDPNLFRVSVREEKPKVTVK